MSTTTAHLFDTTQHTTNVWLKDLEMMLGWGDRPAAYHALRTVLHALRDRLTVDEVATLGRSYRCWCAASTTRAGAPPTNR
jgi:hypothetical protein